MEPSGKRPRCRREITLSDRRANWSRRQFVNGLALAGTAGLLAAHRAGTAAEPPPETGTIRVSTSLAICTAPQLVSEDLLRAEGFNVVQHLTRASLGALAEVAAGEVDIGITFIGPTIIQVDASQPITVLAGVHPPTGGSSTS